MVIKENAGGCNRRLGRINSDLWVGEVRKQEE